MCLETPSSDQKPSEEAVSRSEGSVAIWMTLISTTRRVPVMKPVGKPDAGNPHVRFDERGWETGRCHMAQLPRPSSPLQRGCHPELRFAIRLNNSQDTVVAENSKTRVEAASQLYAPPQFSIIRNPETSRIPNPIRDDTWRRTE